MPTEQLTLDKILLGLRSRNEETRQRSASDLVAHLRRVYNEVYGESFQKYLNDVNRTIFELISGNDVNDKQGGILAIDRLIDFQGEELLTMVNRYAHYLRITFPHPDPHVMTLASKALGKLASRGGTLAADVVEFEITRSLDWLQLEKNDNRRYAGILILHEFTLQIPSYSLNFMVQLLDRIWSCLRDAKLPVRFAAADLLKTCLDLVSQRQIPSKYLWFQRAIDENMKGFKIGSVEAIHGSLLILHEVFHHGGSLQDENVVEISRAILKYKDHKDILIRRTLTQFLPDLASYNPQLFAENFLDVWMAFLFGLLKKERDKGFIYSALGKLITSLGPRIAPYLDSIVAHIKDGFASRNRNRTSIENNIYESISCILKGHFPTINKYARELLDLLFNGDLTPGLYQALIDYSQCIPSSLMEIQERLLEALSHILCKRSFRNLVVESSLSKLVVRDIQSPDPKDIPTIMLALDVFGSFNFLGHITTDLLRECARLYLDHENIQIRRAAVINVCKMLNHDPIFKEDTPLTKSIMVDLTGKLLNVAISDPEQTIRMTVFESLVEDFDDILAFPGHVNTLFLALNDEDYAIQKSVVKIVGRLSNINPAAILPPLRKNLILLLNTLQFSNNQPLKEESTYLLTMLIQSCYSLIHSYSEPIFYILKPQLDSEQQEDIIVSVLTAIGELFKAGGDMLLDHLDCLLPTLLEIAQDQRSINKRKAALMTIGLIVSNTGYVVEPFLKYPQFLDILAGILKSEQHQHVRSEAVKLFGIIGAVDPNHFKGKEEYYTTDVFYGLEAGHKESLAVAGASTDDVSLPVEDPYAGVAIHALLQILKDASLEAHHLNVLQAILYIFKALGLKASPLLPQIIPPFLTMLETCPIHMVEYNYQQIGSLIPIVKYHLRAYVGELVRIMMTLHWNLGNISLQLTLLNVISSLAEAMKGEFRCHLTKIMPKFIQVLDNLGTEKLSIVQRIFQILVLFGSSLEDYLHLLLPHIARIYESTSYSVEIRKSCLESIKHICLKCRMKDHASRIIHPLIRMLQQPIFELRDYAFDALTAVVFILREEFIAFVPVISKLITKHRLRNVNYDILISKMLNDEPFPLNLFDESLSKGFLNPIIPTPSDEVPIPLVKRLPINQQSLRKAWEASQKSTKEDWLEWMRRLSIELLKESPSHCLRACANLGGIYYPLSRELFNPAFVAVWEDLFDEFQQDFVKSLETALSSSNIPPEIVQILLNLAEYLEHEEKDLPLDIQTLGAFASRCHAYAKALHYKEMEYLRDASSETIESLISINNLLQLPDAAIGILVHAQKKHSIELQESWYEKLQRWDDALDAYERKLAQLPPNPNFPPTLMEQLGKLSSNSYQDPHLFQPTTSTLDVNRVADRKLGESQDMLSQDAGNQLTALDVTFGIMRCLYALGDWERLSKISQETWPKADVDLKRVMAPLAAAASWGLGEWEMMDEYIHVIKPDTPNGAFFRAILAVHRNLSSEALKHVEKTRELLDTELTALLGESYNRAYDVIVRLQMLAELEEIIEMKKHINRPKKQEIIRKAWLARLKGSQRTVEVWQRFLKVRSLGISPDQDISVWIKFANLCRKNKRSTLAEKTLVKLLQLPLDRISNLDILDGPVAVSYLYLKHRWTLGFKETTLLSMRKIIDLLSSEMAPMIPSSQFTDPPLSLPTNAPLHPKAKLLSKCLLKYGIWTRDVAESAINEDSEEAALNNMQSFSLAARYDTASCKAWQEWALSNFSAISRYERRQDVPESTVTGFVTAAMQGFFRSILSSKGFSLQDTLRILTLWFKYGAHPDVVAVLSDGFSIVPIETWLQVIPQLIARIHAPSHHIRKQVHQLLLDIGKTHPQAIIYSLTVASKSQGNFKKNAASIILDKMRLHSSRLVDQALLVSQELIRIAILWHELWHAGLDEASRFYVGHRNYAAMFNVLEPLHHMIDRGAETLRETSFLQAFGRELKEAQEYGAKYKRTGNVDEIHAAWDLYYQVGRKIHKQLNQMTVLEFQFVSPQLLSANHLELAVPGTYRSGEEIIKISSFHPSCQVITSKQRPRKVSIYGSDGKEYQYLLKGHEDLRQDERVMQLFGLANHLLLNDDESKRRHLGIQRYPVIPLSPNSGLIGWVPHCDTVHSLIKDYRETHHIPLNMEHRLMLQMGPDYDHMTLLQKMEVFEYALHHSSGQDLSSVLWLKSKNAEAWLDRRISYTRTLAVMSIVGYILGLGDRHPSNLMINRETGKVIHIDFGDCFEVAMMREKYPERIPFRLTRMLISAMEVSGIEGTFRITCEHVMRVLRENKDSLMAVLEAFVYDPLISWRLFGTTLSGQTEAEKHGEMGGHGGGQENMAQSFFRQPSFIDITGSTDEEDALKQEGLNPKALAIISRISNKLTGLDFKTLEGQTLTIEKQVDKLVNQATSVENLCQCYIGWCPFW